MLCVKLLNLNKQQTKCFLLIDKFTVKNGSRSKDRERVLILEIFLSVMTILEM